MVKQAVGIVLGVALLSLAGCGPSEEQKSAAEDARAAADTAAERVETAEEQAARKLAIYEKCSNQVAPFMRSLAALDSRLGIGLSYANYSEEVADVRVVYDRIPFGNMDVGCFDSGIAGENALNRYADAYNVWNECFADIYCDTDSIEPELQDHWAAATRQVTKAKVALADLKRSAIAAENDLSEAEEEVEEKEEEAIEAEAELE